MGLFLDGLEKIVGRDINFNIFMTGKTSIVNVGIITFVFSSCIFDTNDKQDVTRRLVRASVWVFTLFIGVFCIYLYFFKKNILSNSKLVFMQRNFDNNLVSNKNLD